MFLDTFIKSLLPKSYSFPEQVIALTVVNTSLLISLAMLLLVLYWIFTKSFETIKTIFVMLGVILLLAVCIGLEIWGHASAGALLLVTITILLNFANMSIYGIPTSASSGYILSILLASLCLGSPTGYIIAIAGCIFVFAIPIISSKKWIHTVLPYQTSNITFDAPTLSLIYLLAALIIGSWVNLIKSEFF